MTMQQISRPTPQYCSSYVQNVTYLSPSPVEVILYFFFFFLLVKQRASQPQVQQKKVAVIHSGGCRDVHDWVDTRPQDRHRITAVGLLSDPYRPYGRWQHRVPDPGGWGICGQRVGHLPHDTLWSSHPDDVISSCPPDSPLRTLADLSDRIPGGFIDDFVNHIRLRDWQLATHIGMWRHDPLGYLRSLGPRMELARRGVYGYLTGAHTTAYTRPYDTHDGDLRPLVDRLADSLSWKIRHP